ncbi:uncharacterized protein TNCV_4397061 [Trichonephila clavipes]|nr:uncharacterized protein TNCV_4397061 [Trichonephila clavipes]
MRSFITREISRQLKLPVVRKETLSVYSFGAKQATEKTYNVVKIQLDEEDRDVTRFLWNENPNGPEELIQSYRMTRVLFGLNILIQELWCLGLDWDEFFPKNLESSWNEWCEEVPELNTFSIPRYYLGYALQNEIDNIQIHCFSDSSKKAYEWRHCPGKDNPADLLSRGMSASELHEAVNYGGMDPLG